jgi:NADPH:quinone reductase-like Zn-dependent oxidoreductase
MRAALFHDFGPPDVIRVEDVPLPEPGPGEVRLRVLASSLNHLDLWVRRGLPISIPIPHIGGSDLAGVVDAVGAPFGGAPSAGASAPEKPDPGVRLGTRVVVDPTLDWAWITGVRRGAGLPSPELRVIGEHTQGGFAQFAIVPAANLIRIPDGVSFETAAAAALVSVTAYRALFTRGGLRAGERVLITGGSGGVSTMAVQMARNAGAEVFVLTSGAESRARLLELGAHHVVDRSDGEAGDLLRRAVGRRGVDLVVDSVGEALWDALLKLLAPAGRLVNYGATAGHRVTLDLRHVFWKQLSILGTTMGSPDDFVRAMELVFRGVIHPVIHARVELDGVADAHARLEAGGVLGKIVVLPWGAAEGARTA